MHKLAIHPVFLETVSSNFWSQSDRGFEFKESTTLFRLRARDVYLEMAERAFPSALDL